MNKKGQGLSMNAIKEFLKFIWRTIMISGFGFIILIPVVNTIIMDNVFNSDKDVRELKELLFKEKHE